MAQGAVIGVSAAGDAGTQGHASFTKGIFADERGDVATFTVETTGTSRATVRVGGESVNYAVEFTVVDGDGDGSVTVAWNTHLAAHEPAVEVFSAVDGGDSVRNAVREMGGFDSPTRRLDAGEYPLAVSVDGEETDLATFAIREPDDFDRSLAALRGRQALATRAVPEHLDANGTVAQADYVVLQVKTSGVFGYVDSATDLAEGTQGVSVSIEQTNHESNEDPTVIDPASFTLITEPETDRLFLVAPTDQGAFTPGERYRATFSIDAAANPYADSDVQLTMSFEVVYRDATIDGAGGAGNELGLQPTSQATISGTSPLADGTQLEVELRSEDDAFLQRQTVTVRDGTFAATFDLSGASTGSEYEVTVREDRSALAFTKAVVREPASLSMPDQESDGETLVVEDVSLPDGGFVAVYDPDESRAEALLGRTSYLQPGEYDTVEVPVSGPLEVDGKTFVAVAHRDTNGDRQFGYVDSSGSVDGPYERDGQSVGDDGRVSVTSTPASTATPTPESTDAADDPGSESVDTGTPTPEAADGEFDNGSVVDRDWESTPGFGLTAAVVALVGAALVARRRQ
ncbi:hypothetical protein BRC81_06760 [Halobacteriales archaeon QS_1_68_20]|nr:MAG: hypothetical protein BRC81_06760 [Halobacteriales archaeon QS_1_68_20]